MKVDLLVVAGSAVVLYFTYKWAHERGRALGYGRGWLDGRNQVVSGKPKTPAELAAEATVLQFLYPTLTAALAWILLGESPSRRGLAALLIGVPMAQAPQALQLKKAGAALLQCAAPPPSGSPPTGLVGSARLALLLPPRALLGPRGGHAPSGR